MFKLKIRSNPMIALGVLISIGAPTGAYFILKGMTDKLIELHLAAVIAIIIILPAVVTLVAYQMTSAAQKVKICSLMIGIVLILASIDNLIFPQMRLLADSILLFNWIAFLVVLAGGIAATFCLVSVVPDSIYLDGAQGAEKEDPKEKKRRELEEKEAERAMSQTGSNAVRSTMARIPAVNAENMVLKAAEETTAAKTTPGPQPATNAREEERKAGSTSATNLKGLLDTLAPEDDDDISSAKTTVATTKPEAKGPVKSMLKVPQKPDSPASQLTRPGTHPTPAQSSPPAPEIASKPEEKAPPTPPFDSNATTATTTRLQAQKRKGTSTFTKLQALSASGGAGSRAGKTEGGEGEGLKSILDRLDSTADTTEEAPMDSLFGGGRLVSSRTDIPAIDENIDTDTTSAPAPAASTSPASPPSQLKRPGLGVTLGGGNKLKAEPAPAPTPAPPTPPVTPAVGAPAPLPAAPPTPAVGAPAPLPAAPPTPAVQTPTEDATASGESISDMLNSIQTPSILQKEPGAASIKPASGGLGSTALGKAASTHKIGLGSLGSTSATDLSPVREPSAEPEVELLQPTAAPVMEKPVFEEPAPEGSFSDETPRDEIAPPTPVANAPTEDEDSQSIFAKGLDEEIDDIFSNLVPEEAQKEFKDVPARVSLEEISFASSEADNAEPEAPEIPKELRQTAKVESEVEEEEESEGGLFKGLDQELDDIFDNLVPAEAQREVDKSDVVQRPVAAPFEETTAVAAEAEDSEQSSLFGNSLDSELDDIFSNLAPDEAQKKVTSETLAQVRGAESAASEEEISFAPPASTKEAPIQTDSSNSGKFVDTLGNLPALDAAKVPVQLSAPKAVAQEQTTRATETAEHPVLEETSDQASTVPPGAPAKEIKEFGRLSARVVTGAKNNETPGTMKTIGKLLIDVQAVENVIRNGETGQIGKNLASARVLSAQRGEGIQMILNKIDAYPGIAGSLIVGHDGLVIASTLKDGMDRDSLGVLSVACLSTSNLGTRKLEIGKLKQMVMITNTTVSVLTDVDVGILAVFMSAVEIDKIDGLLETIQTTIHG
jgi:predicted regulator of Ras-like GTPase activity (Roadblock/LC7/MglB family)